MRNVRYYPLLVTLLFSTCLVVSAQTRTNVEIKRINAYSKRVDSGFQDEKKPHLVFADVSQSAKPKWRKFVSSAALEKFREGTETYTIANNWMKNGKVVLTIFTLFSESGDWAKYVHSYFRHNGTLAKVETDYRTFHGDFHYSEKLYFDERGKLLAKDKVFKDLETKKIIVPDKGDLEDNSPMMNSTDYYKSTNRLPYAHLLAGK